MVVIDEKTAIRRLYLANINALNAGNFSALKACYTFDAIQLPPYGPPLKGWPAIRSSLEKTLRDVTIEANLEITDIVVTGNWAYARGEYQVRTIPRVGGEETITKGSWFDILKRQKEGTWKITRSTWSD